MTQPAEEGVVVAEVGEGAGQHQVHSATVSTLLTNTHMLTRV